MRKLESGEAWEKRGNDNAVKATTSYNAQKGPADDKLDNHAKNWAKIVDDFLLEKLNPSLTYKIMDTPLVVSLIKDIDISVTVGIPLKITYKIMHKILVDINKHALDVSKESFKKLPLHLANPVMILKNRNSEGELIKNEVVAITELKDNKGRSIIVPISFALKNNAYYVKTFFGREEGKGNITWLNGRIAKGDVLYADKKRTSELIKPAGQQSPIGLSIKSSFYGSIPNKNDLVKLKEQNPQMYSVATTNDIQY